MRERYIRISVGLRLDDSEMADFNVRNKRVLDILFEQNNKVEFTIVKKDIYTEIEYRASIPASQAMGPHNINSRLIKSWPEDAGAGWIEEI